MIPEPLIPILIAASAIVGAAILISAVLIAWLIPQLAHMIHGDYEPEDEDDE